MRNIALDGKITIIKTLALSKTVYLTLIQIQKNKKTFIWNNLTPKIKHETLCNSCEEGMA